MKLIERKAGHFPHFVKFVGATAIFCAQPQTAICRKSISRPFFPMAVALSSC